jgi:HD-GYP domain-containing protein (c-di-GMP phosphodiesterase class II)
MKGEVGKFDPVLFNLFIKNAEEFNKIRTKYSEQETGEA